MSYKCYIFDLDDTLLDFHAGEQQGLVSVFETFQTRPLQFSDWFATYQQVNQDTWRQIEQGALAQPLLDERFAKTFAAFHQSIDGAQAETHYRHLLDTNYAILPGSRELLTQLSQTGIHLVAGTNGKATTQYQRLAQTGFDQYFQQIVISSEIGHAKPSRAFFEFIFQLYPTYQPADFLMIGDSLHSDIAGANHAEIDSVWLNQTDLTHDSSSIHPTYQVHSMAELAQLLCTSIPRTTS